MHPQQYITPEPDPVEPTDPPDLTRYIGRHFVCYLTDEFGQPGGLFFACKGVKDDKIVIREVYGRIRKNGAWHPTIWPEDTGKIPDLLVNPPTDGSRDIIVPTVIGDMEVFVLASIFPNVKPDGNPKTKSFAGDPP